VVVAVGPDEALAADPAVGPALSSGVDHPFEALGAGEILVVAAGAEGLDLAGAAADTAEPPVDVCGGRSVPEGALFNPSHHWLLSTL